MATLLRFNGYRVVMYSNDHRPAHVHVIGRGGEAVFKLRCPGGPPELREVYGLRGAALGQIERVITSELFYLCAHWNNNHGIH